MNRTQFRWSPKPILAGSQSDTTAIRSVHLVIATGASKWCRRKRALEGADRRRKRQLAKLRRSMGTEASSWRAEEGAVLRA